MRIPEHSMQPGMGRRESLQLDLNRVQDGSKEVAGPTA